MKYITFALAKGRLARNTLALLEKIVIKFKKIKKGLEEI